MVWPAILVTAVSLIFSIITAVAQMRNSKKIMELNAKEQGMVYSMITGIPKIRLSGSEKRAFARWGKLYAKEASAMYELPVVLKYNAVITLTIGLIGTLVMYYAAVKSHVSVADYYAFTSAYAYLSTAFGALAGIAQTTAAIKPILEIIDPVLKAQPEVAEDKEVVTRLSGRIELSHVTFSYPGSDQKILDDISLKIRPGQYVAVVGKTGCGKSTLLRCLLGFESPQKGAIYYDGKDMTRLDLRSLRRKIGVVLQNGKLVNNDIFSNITIAAPWLKLDDAWEAAEIAGIADDIREMPMGMQTIVQEGSGGISGGQRQRIMIARAVAPDLRFSSWMKPLQPWTTLLRNMCLMPWVR
ncbi:MAG: ATP-binding cassette domain-containing protein [Lachnospiraceae bacterium]|nr:ATP-binding cassette domain-containing protein [Candidatus Equihabitans merdae]